MADPSPALYTRHHVEDVVKSFLDGGKKLVALQVESYNNYVNYLIPLITQENSVVTVISEECGLKHVVSFGRIRIQRPVQQYAEGLYSAVMPQTCKNQSLSYVATVMIDVKHQVFSFDKDDAERTYTLLETIDVLEYPLFEIPAMVGSDLCNRQRRVDAPDECRFDHGGYFIVNGNDKVIIPQENQRINNPLVMRCRHTQNKYSFMCEVRSHAIEEKIRSTSTLRIYITRAVTGEMPSVFVAIPFVTAMDVPLAYVFTLLGISDLPSMLALLVGKKSNRHNKIRPLAQGVLEESGEALTQDEVLALICKNGFSDAPLSTATYRPQGMNAADLNKLLANELLPHIALTNHPVALQRKALFIAMAVRKLLYVFSGDRPPDDRDDYSNIHIELPGYLLATLTRFHWRIVLKQINKSIHCAVGKKYITPTDLLTGSKRITNALRFAISTGNWGTQKGGSTQKGVAQQRTNTNPAAAVSHQRRINSGINRESKQSSARQLHPSTRGYLCANETPEGQACGLLKVLALTAEIRLPGSSRGIAIILRNTNLVVTTQVARRECEDAHIDWVTVLLNGVLMGVTKYPTELREKMSRFRQSMDIGYDVGLFFDETMGIFWIDALPGRCVRPLFNIAAFREHFHRLHRDFYRSEQRGDVGRFWFELILHGVV